MHADHVNKIVRAFHPYTNFGSDEFAAVSADNILSTKPLDAVFRSLDVYSHRVTIVLKVDDIMPEKHTPRVSLFR